MPTEISNDTKYINSVFTYILHISGSLINRQKTFMNIMGIKSFFDVVVLKDISLSIFSIVFS